MRYRYGCSHVTRGSEYLHEVCVCVKKLRERKEKAIRKNEMGDLHVLVASEKDGKTKREPILKRGQPFEQMHRDPIAVS